MKAKRTLIGVLILVGMMAGLAIIPPNAKMVIEQDAVPFGVGSVSVPTPEAPETGEDGNADDSILVTADVSKSGILALDIDTQNTSRMKVKIVKENETLYYDVDSDHHLDIPLQLGDGGYTVKVFRHVKDSEYEAVFTADVAYTAENPNDVFLASNEIVNYHESKSVYGLTQNVIDGAEDEMEIVSRITGYVLDEFSYNTGKAETLTTDYIPNIDTVLLDKSGICYDFAAVTAAMLREAGIPAKLVMGYRNDSELYHAWNEVLVDGEWLVVDTTWDSVMQHRKISFQNPEVYSAEKMF